MAPIARSLRFGLGPRPGDDTRADSLPSLATDLDTPPALPGAGLATASDGLAANKAARDARRAMIPGAGDPVRAVVQADRAAIFAGLLAEPHGFRERLVSFWANHFTVSVRQGECRALAGAFRREAIAPHVTGRFGDMLLAVMRHPAMLHYLDNAGSVGPDSRAGQRGHRGLNENLARESLELHTLSPASGYTQADVTSYAAILTGWSVQEASPPYGYIFRPGAHQPGSKILLGRAFPEGEEGGIEALAFLAGHPSTHAHLARKLVTHFGADTPDPRQVDRIARLLARTEGDLHQVSLALLELPFAPLGKLRSPIEVVVASYRALGLPAETHPGGPALTAYLGQPILEAPLPNGWPDRTADWAGPLPVLRRADTAAIIAGHAAADLDPASIARNSLGPLLRPETASAIAHAGSRKEALTYLLASAEFQRR
jgi:uncharacterized protein (DUF1800 family)